MKVIFFTPSENLLAECESFYTKLYASNFNTYDSIDTSAFFKHENDTILEEDEQR